LRVLGMEGDPSAGKVGAMSVRPDRGTVFVHGESAGRVGGEGGAGGKSRKRTCRGRRGGTAGAAGGDGGGMGPVRPEGEGTKGKAPGSGATK
jgi:hypothetical protein